jgi:hypothetical protein
MMQSGQDWRGDDSSESFDGSPARRILAQAQVRARPIVIGRIRGQDPVQMPFAKDQDMIQAVTPNRPDRAFNMGIHQV